MAQGWAQFIGNAGQYYVAYALSARGYHAAITKGNAPNVDILVSSADGGKLISLQVKTSRNAHRAKRYGHEVYEWDVGSSAIGRSGVNIWYAFVDLRESETDYLPQVFLVPSLWVSEFVKPDHSRKMYLLKAPAAELCRGKWDFIGKYFAGDPDVLQWATTHPDSAKWE